MKIVFFEVQDWEENLLRTDFNQAKLTKDKLTDENVSLYKGTEILSSFIYSTLNKKVLDKLPNLKLIATRSTGFDHIDIDYCKERGIVVSNVPEYGSNTVAEHTFALILNLTRKIYRSVNQARELNFNHRKIRGTDIYKKTIGIIGLGKIGQNVLRIARGFGMKVLVFNRSQDKELMKKYKFNYVSLDDLIKNSDIVTLHLPLLPKTRHLINKQNVKLFKKGSYLINTARGGLIDTETLIYGLEEGIFAGVGLDVLEEEKDFIEEAAILTKEFHKKINLKKLILDHILLNHPKVLITPHNAFNSKEALLRIEKTTIENIKSYIKGKIINSL